MDKIPPLHPGQMLLLEFLEPLSISQYRLAKDIGVSQTRIGEIVNGKRGITADTALRLSRYFGMSAEFWLNLQTHYEIEIAKDAIGDAIEASVKPLPQPLLAPA